MTAKLPEFLALVHPALKAEGIDIEPKKAKRAVLAMLSKLGGIPIPSPMEAQQALEDARTLELKNQGISVEKIALRLGCNRATIYRRLNRALKLKLTA